MGCEGQAATSQASAEPAAWHLVAVHALPGRSFATGEGETIAIVDTGLTDVGLASIHGRLVEARAATGDLVDENGHGTSLTLIAAGGGDQGVFGLAPKAMVMPVKVADSSGHAAADEVAAGVAWAAAHHADVINVSLATMVASPRLAAAVADAVDAHIIVVAAAGDTGASGPEFPASISGVLAVYAQNRAAGIARLSNLPRNGGILAPGEDIQTLNIRSGARKSINGTSAAAAVVSGLAADCLSAERQRKVPAAVAEQRCMTALEKSSRVGRFIRLDELLELAA
jgi:subtilisin family serine protease